MTQPGPQRLGVGAAVLRVLPGHNDLIVFEKWRFNRRTDAIKPHNLRFAPDGRIALHRDYWDAAEELYEKLPLVGALFILLIRGDAGIGKTALLDGAARLAALRFGAAGFAPARFAAFARPFFWMISKISRSIIRTNYTDGQIRTEKYWSLKPSMNNWKMVVVYLL